MILGIEMLVTVAVIGYFGYHYGSILLAGFKSAKASISSQTPVQDPGYPIDVDGQAPTNQVQADTEVVTEEVDVYKRQVFRYYIQYTCKAYSVAFTAKRSDARSCDSPFRL